MEKRETVCFTGHRATKLCGYDIEKYTDFVNQLVLALEDYTLDHNITNFITGGAQGFDQLAYWAVNILKRKRPYLNIQNIVCIPFNGQESRWADEGLFSKADYNNMLSCADKVIICNKEITNKSGYPLIVDALMERNKLMVNSSSRVIALCSEHENETNNISGGTGNCVRYAKLQDKPIDKCVYKMTTRGMKLKEMIIE